MEASKFICKKCNKVEEVKSFEQIVKLKKVCYDCRKNELTKKQNTRRIKKK